MPDSFDYSVVNSENAQLLQAIIDDAPSYTKETGSRNAEILKSIINDTEYTDAPQSEIEELLLELKEKIAGGGGDITIEELTVTENGTYSEQGKAYSPVKVELPLSSKTITENGTYTASDDNLAGFNEVTVAVEGYALEDIENTPTAIATFNASALPMPSLKVGIEAVQSGTGDPSPTNVRPISGFSAVNVNRSGINLWDEEWELGSYSTSTGEKTEANNRIRCKNPIKVVGGSTIYISSANSNMRIYLYYPNGDYKTSPSLLADTEYTIPDDVGWMTFNMATTYGTTYNNDVSINYPSTDTDYHAYNGTTYTTTLKDSQGNPMVCYGGELSNVNGVQSLENETQIVVFDGSSDEAWIEYQGAFYVEDVLTGINGVTSKTSPICMCNMYKEENAIQRSGQLPNREDYSFFNQTESYITRLWVKDSRYSTVEDFKTALASQPLQIKYPLATPQTIPQDNLAIATQDGTNNLWADSGDVLEGSYFKEL